MLMRTIPLSFGGFSLDFFWGAVPINVAQLFKKMNEPDGSVVFKFELTVEQDGECYVVVFED